MIWVACWAGALAVFLVGYRLGRRDVPAGSDVELEELRQVHRLRDALVAARQQIADERSETNVIIDANLDLQIQVQHLTAQIEDLRNQ